MSAPPREDFKRIAARVQQRVLDSIPPQWRMARDIKSQHDGDALSFVETCGILTNRQLEITLLTATEVLKLIHTGQLKAADVVEAFCARAAISHQLVNCLTEFFPETAIAQAKALDEEFDRTGKLVGPLREFSGIYIGPEILAELITAMKHTLITC